MSDPICYENPNEFLPNPPASASGEPVDVERLQDALAAKTDDCLRLAAAFDNYKKLNRRDTERQTAAEKESFVQELASRDQSKWTLAALIKW